MLANLNRVNKSRLIYHLNPYAHYYTKNRIIHFVFETNNLRNDISFYDMYDLKEYVKMLLKNKYEKKTPANERSNKDSIMNKKKIQNCLLPFSICIIK